METKEALRSTLNLPKTDFPMKASLPQREPDQVRCWQEQNTYFKMLEKNQGKDFFVLHDGPPYANGNIHLGHTLNKILKDIVVKYKNMSGYGAAFIPGWDCHGLPIELGVEKKLTEKKQDRKDISKIEYRKLCREYALKHIYLQKDQFKRLGVLADWENPYFTMNQDYVANIVRELGRIAEAGSFYKGNKPVYWCIQCATALADAEIEYHDHTSPSVYVKFYLDSQAVQKIKASHNQVADKLIAAVVWTTTPWTLPANLGLAFHPEFQYALLDTGSEILIVAEGLREKFLAETKVQASKLGEVKAHLFDRMQAQHPFMNRTSLLLLAEHVTLDVGTGIVHTAPGHGVDDYRVGQKYGLEPFSPVDGHGCFTSDVPRYQGKKVFAANKVIIEDLKNSGHLLAQSTLVHSYPQCWRCNKPVIFRATPQWFISMDDTSLRKRCIEWIHKVEWIPSWGINRILGMIESRPDWCISRQRIWGVPITIFYCSKCGEAIVSKESFNHVADLIEKEGPDIWFEWPVEKLLKAGLKCAGCNEASPAHFTKDSDILDVWFDSGVSHAAVVDAEKNRNHLRWPSDLYLEGSDQHRGWFQTSLLTSVETRNAAPYKRVLTHGFVNDKEGKKMSKSKGNVTDPLEFISKYGAEILRLWVVLEDYRNDVNFSYETIERIVESYRKVRNTFRYILGNIYDYDPSMDPGDGAFLELDQWALYRTQKFLERLKQSYESYEFHIGYHALVNFCSVEMSSLYFDILKDRLYTSRKDSAERRSAQAALYRIGEALATGLAPIFSFTAEEVWGYLKKKNSIFEAEFPIWKPVAGHEVTAQKTEHILEIRELVNKELEKARAQKVIGHSLEALVELTLTNQQMELMATTQESLARIFIVSQVQLKAGSQTEISIKHATGQKCARCWVYNEEVGRNQKFLELCHRCAEVVQSV